MAKKPAGGKGGRGSRRQAAEAAAAAAAEAAAKESAKKLVAKSTLTTLLSSAKRRREQVDKINLAYATEVKTAADKRGLDRDVYNVIEKLSRKTGTYLANWKEHFDHMWIAAGLEKLASEAPTLGLEREQEGEGEGEETDGTRGATVTKFPQAAE